MIIDPWKLEPINLYVNPQYRDLNTRCRFKKNDVTFIIERTVTGGKITIDYEVVFESMVNCDTVASASFQVVAEFKPPKVKKDDLIRIEQFLIEIFLAVDEFLEDNNNLSPGMLSTPTRISSSLDTIELTEHVSGELIRRGFY